MSPEPGALLFFLTVRALYFSIVVLPISSIGQSGVEFIFYILFLVVLTIFQPFLLLHPLTNISTFSQILVFRRSYFSLYFAFQPSVCFSVFCAICCLVNNNLFLFYHKDLGLFLPAILSSFPRTSYFNNTKIKLIKLEALCRYRCGLLKVLNSRIYRPENK